MSWRRGLASEEGLKKGSSRHPLVASWSGFAMREKLGIQIRKKFRRPRIDKSSLFVFGNGQLIKAWILSGGIVLCRWDMESPR